MKTYLIDWDGEYGIVCADNIRELGFQCDATLADATRATRICELNRKDVFDIRPNGDVIDVTDSDQKREWFVLEYSKSLNKFNKRYLKDMSNI
jgi:hypothetical protein